MTIRVLLVEDDWFDRILFTRALGAEYSVRSASRLTEAFSKLIGDDEAFDIVVADLGLPDAQGLDVLKALRNFNTQIPIVSMTGRSNDEELAAQALTLGIQDYTKKTRSGYKHLRSVLSNAMASI